MDTAQSPPPLTSPPSYSLAATESSRPPPVLLNLAPSSTDSDADCTTFQIGLLGLDTSPTEGGSRPPAAIAGEVQVKYTAAGDSSSSSTTSDAASWRPQYARLQVTFKGIETAGQGQDITLVEQTATLWELGDAAAATAVPPAVSRFRFELTPDLPACVHLASSSLSYSLTATLFPLPSTLEAANDPYFAPPQQQPQQPLSRTVPVHLVRTSSPASLFPLRPSTVTCSDPIHWRVRFPRTRFTRREPIGLVVRVEVPDSKRIGEGLRLRTISAELVRTITTTTTATSGVVASSSSSSAATQDGSGGEEAPAVMRRRTVLAHSGKSARFSPSRPIIIRLVLHPPLEPTCESISQSTILHTVSFAVRVTVGLVNTGSSSSTSSSTAPAGATSTSSSAIAAPASSDNHHHHHAGPAPLDTVLMQELTILPDLPPSTSTLPRSDKQKEVERAAAATTTLVSLPSWEEDQPDAPVPSYVENSLLDPGTTTGAGPPTASTSSGWLSAAPPSQAAPPPPPPSGYTLSSSLDHHEEEDNDEDEEEYDGYEELSLSASLSERPPPPRIDDDISPPSAGEPSSEMGYRLASYSGEVIGEGEEVEEVQAGGGAAFEDAGGVAPAGVLQPLPSRTMMRSADGDNDLEPETPPPPVDYELPYLPPAVVADSSDYPPPPPPPESLPSTPPPAHVLFGQKSGCDAAHHEEGDQIPSSPPPPLSPLEAEHPLPALPLITGLQRHYQGLPPPYAGRLQQQQQQQSPPPPPLSPPPAVSLDALRSPMPSVVEAGPNSSSLSGASASEQPPRPRPTTSSAMGSQTSHEQHQHQIGPAILDYAEGGGPPAPATDANNNDDVHDEVDSEEEDHEARPPPYEQRDADSRSSPPSATPSVGIQWGMMHAANNGRRRGELVL
ncbi:hypothetical protein JCM10908_001759 [Rhodotorula pacifica]|uniref:uncharacterized protein n=1 Tax=Rhodotorula pacifica TaxID=1495444 RepID=UPI00317DE3D5